MPNYRIHMVAILLVTRPLTALAADRRAASCSRADVLTAMNAAQAGCYRTGLMSGSWTGWLMVIAGLISWDPALEGWSGRST